MHPTWALGPVVAALLPIKLPVNGLGKATGLLRLLSHMEDLVGALGLCLLPGPTPGLVVLSNESVDGEFLHLCNSAFKMNV